MAQARYSPLTASGLFAGPSNVLGIGNPMTPETNPKLTTGIGDSGKDFAQQVPGSGDLL